MTGFVNLNLGDDVKESKAVPNGPYSLTIASYELGESREKKTPQYKWTINIDGHDDAMPINHFTGLPSPKDEPKAAKFKALLLKRFLVAFKIPHTAEGFNPDDAIGRTATLEVQQGEPNASGDVYNNIVIPRMSDETSSQGTPAQRVAAAKKR